MEFVDFTDAETYEPEDGWQRVSLAGSDAFTFEWFEKPAGHSSPMHHHENEQVCVVLEGEMVVHTGTTPSPSGSTTPSGWRPTNPTASRTRATNARSVSTYSRRAAASTTGPTAKSSTADRHWAVDHDQRLVPMTDTTSSATPGGMDFSNPRNSAS